jgi:hypothetical protein
MRLPALLTVACLAALALSGCGSPDDGSGTTTDDGHGHTTAPTTSRAPNVPPQIVLKVTNATGAETMVTTVGGVLTFDASASTDPDGDGIAAMAMAVTDANGTSTPEFLFQGGQFSTVEFTFANAGPANVTVSAIDARGGLTTISQPLYVNLDVVLGADKTFTGAIPAAGATANACKGPSGQAAADDLVWARHAFPVGNGTTRITATVQSGTAEIAICAPDGTAASSEGTTASTASGAVLPAGEYFVSVVSGAANQKAPVRVVVQYDPVA